MTAVLLSAVLTAGMMTDTLQTNVLAKAGAKGTAGLSKTASHTHENVIFSPWTKEDSLPNSGGFYYLEKDVTLSETWTPSSNTRLCLNGHTITTKNHCTVIHIASAVSLFALYDCQNSGTISPNVPLEDETVPFYPAIRNDGIFQLNGGIICDNVSAYGAGVFNSKTATARVYIVAKKVK